MKEYIYLTLLIFSIIHFSCENYLEPRNENFYSEERIKTDISRAEGLLLRAYISLPSDYNFETDIATDDAVTNDVSSSYRRMAIGEWKASFNPISVWSSAYREIYHINKFLEIYESVNWAIDPRLSESTNNFRDEHYRKRLEGEALGLRAWYKLRLLQYHGGKVDNGELLGFPIVDNTLKTTDDWKLPRNTYAECVASIFSDCDNAIENLPATWFDKPTGGDHSPLNAYYNETTGERYENRINGNIVRAIKARTALLAASPAFSEGSGVTWEQAAILAGDLLKELGELYENNHTFYKEIKNKEILWNKAFEEMRQWEQINFPPSLFGYGRTNPSQNLVNAFPMSNGYPINHSLSGYDPDDPYKGRDNRFDDYIIHNNSTVRNKKINTYIGAPLDGIDVLTSSTRTGYYLKKLMSESVNLDPNNTTNAAHTYTLLRMTELLLNYAEAANEAWGPDGDPKGLGFTARSKIAELRRRAGIDAEDPYLASVEQNELRMLIRNERRISLCFEGFRFWDIRRWLDYDIMQQPVRAALLTQESGGETSYRYREIEDRGYQQYMIYGPIPYEEVLKTDLKQNNGW